MGSSKDMPYAHGHGVAVAVRPLLGHPVASASLEPRAQT